MSNNPVAGGDDPILETVTPPNDVVNETVSSTPVTPSTPEPASTEETVVTSAPTSEAPAHLTPASHAPEANDDQDVSAGESHDSPESMEAILDQAQDGSSVRRGDLLEGTIARTSPTEILVDVGQKSEGVISGKELERLAPETLKNLKVGEAVKVYVLIPEDRNGNIVLSLSRALEEQDWAMAEEMKTSREVYPGKVDGYNKGGLIVRFGRLRGFVPESQVSRDRRKRAEGTDPQQKWGGMRGEDISVKVVEVDRSRNRLILSERDAVPALREGQKEKLLDELQIGDRKVGVVKSVAEFGAFVDVGGADGLVHVTEISYKHINKPADVLKVGQEVNVEVISIDRERKRIGLSIKRTEEDPWTIIARKYAVGQLVQGTITKMTKFGAFARLVDDPEIEGLIHISELAQNRVEHPRDVVTEGEVLTLRVVKIDGEERRIGLSIKRVNAPEYSEMDYRRATGQDLAGYEAASLKEDRRGTRRKDRKGSGKRAKDDEFSEEF